MLRTELPRRRHAKGKGILLVILSEKFQRTNLSIRGKVSNVSSVQRALRSSLHYISHITCPHSSSPSLSRLTLERPELWPAQWERRQRRYCIKSQPSPSPLLAVRSEESLTLIKCLDIFFIGLNASFLS